MWYVERMLPWHLALSVVLYRLFEMLQYVKSSPCYKSSYDMYFISVMSVYTPVSCLYHCKEWDGLGLFSSMQNLFNAIVVQSIDVYLIEKPL